MNLLQMVNTLQNKQMNEVDSDSYLKAFLP